MDNPIQAYEHVTEVSKAKYPPLPHLKKPEVSASCHIDCFSPNLYELLKIKSKNNIVKEEEDENLQTITVQQVSMI
jgi:hypothetical protein